MQNRYSYLILFLLLVPFVVIACVKNETPDQENPDFNDKVDLKPKEPKRAVFVYINPSSGSTEGEAKRVYVPAGTDSSQTIAIGSASFYDWVEDLKKRLAREKLESANEDCVLIEKIARNNPEHIDIEGKFDLKCVDINTDEPSHTDPSPLDDVDQWVLCQPTDSGPGSSGPGGNPGGGPGAGPGSGPDDPGIGPDGDSGGDDVGDGAGSGSDTVDAMVEILCTPAVRVDPGADPRLIYPAPDQVEAVVVNISPCIKDFCPFEIVFDPPEPIDPTDPIDPSQDEPEELTEDIRGQLMCDSFRGLCEPDVTLISKNDLTKGDDQNPEASDGDCDGVQEDTEKMGEICSDGDVGNMEEEWSNCGIALSESGGVAAVSCTHYDPDANQLKGEHQFTIVEGIGRESESQIDKGQISERKDNALNIAEELTGSDNCTVQEPLVQGGRSITYVDC